MATSDDYLAGIFDGEGCVSVRLAKAGYMSVSVQVSMCDRAPVALLHARFGGRLDDGNQVTRTGRRVYAWTLFGAQCVEALELFSRRCLVKNKVALLALPMARTMQDNPSRAVLSVEEKAARIAAAQAISAINKPVGNQYVLDPARVEAYMAPKKKWRGKSVRLQDGREFESVSAAAHALEVSAVSVSYAARKKTRVCGLKVEYV